jgi:hypothetical protein
MIIVAALAVGHDLGYIVRMDTVPTPGIESPEARAQNFILPESE